MDAHDIMTSPVITVGPDETVLDIVHIMLDNRISAVPVVDGDGKLVGLVSEGDLVHRTEIEGAGHSRWWLTALKGSVSLAEGFVKTHGVKASEIMTRKVTSIAEDTPLWEVAEVLEAGKTKCLPVVRDGEPVGVVTRANLLQAIMVQGEKGPVGASKDDRSIREELIATLKAEKWSDMSHLNIVVSDGTVHLWGLVNSEAQREALRVAAEGVAGVKGTVDHTINAAQLAGGV